MGSGHRGGGLPPGIHQPPSSREQEKGNQDPGRQRAATCLDDRSTAAAQQSRHTQGPRTQDSLLVKFFPHTKEKWPVEADTQLKTSQQVYPPKTIQNGVPAGHYSGVNEGSMGSVSRPTRRVPPHPNIAFAQEVARFFYSRNSIPVSDITIRPINSSPNLHEGGQSHRRIPQKKRPPGIRLSRRLATGRALKSSAPTVYHHHMSAGTTTGTHSQYRKVEPQPVTTHRILRGNTRLQERSSLPNTRTHQKRDVLRISSSSEGPVPGEPVDASVGTDCEHGRHPAVLSLPHESHTITRTVAIQYSPPSIDEAHPVVTQSTRSSSLVDANSESTRRTSIHIGTLVLHTHDRRVQDRMGSPLQEHPHVWSMDSHDRQESHQYARTMGDSPGPSKDCAPRQGEESSCSMRQHVSSSVPEQTRGYEEQDSVPPDPKGSAVVHSPRHSTTSGASPRGRQHSGGRSLQESHRDSWSVEGQGVVSGMAPSASSVSNDLPKDGQTAHRPIRQSIQRSTSDVLLLESGSGSLPSGRDDNELGGNQRICIPTDSTHPQSPSEIDTDKTLQDDLNLPSVAETTLVHAPPVSPSGHSQDSSSSEGSNSDGGESAPDAVDSDDSPDCLAALVGSYREAGLSQEAASMAGQARRDSTRATYNSRLRKYFGWCRREQVDPLRATVKFVGDFLLSLFNEGKSVRSIKSHRTAIGVVHLGFANGSNVSTSPAIRDLIRGCFNKRPPERSLVPSWDLPTALRLLGERPYEPLGNATFEDLTKKTVFLIAAASGRRVSDIHALSVAREHCVVSSSGARLLPRSGYLAKNQTPDFTPSPINLPDLRRAANSPDDGPWCPVRALKYYLKRTEDLRGDEDRLFLITRKPYTGASRQSIARWLVDIIKESLVAEDSRHVGSRVGAHSIRSQASAWASYKGASLAEIINAMGWSSSTTFQTTYLKDVYARGGATAARILSSAAGPTTAASTSSRPDA